MAHRQTNIQHHSSFIYGTLHHDTQLHSLPPSVGPALVLIQLLQLSASLHTDLQTHHLQPAILHVLFTVENTEHPHKIRSVGNYTKTGRDDIHT